MSAGKREKLLLRLELGLLLLLRDALLLPRGVVLAVRAEKVVEVAERGRVAVAERRVVVVVVVRAGPQGEPLVERPREVVTRVRVDRLEQSQADPRVLISERCQMIYFICLAIRIKERDDAPS